MNGKICLLIIMLVIFINSASALTASLGNARMVLKAEVGQSIEKYLTIKNVNNEAVNINLSVSGNLTKELKLDEDNFILQPKEERRVYFTIKPKQPGHYETKINVGFSPLEKGTGVGLSAAIILNVYGEGKLPEEEDNVVDSEDDSETDSETETSKLTGAFLGEGTNIFPIALLSLTTIILVLAFVYILKKVKKKKRSDRSS